MNATKVSFHINCIKDDEDCNNIKKVFSAADQAKKQLHKMSNESI